MQYERHIVNVMQRELTKFFDSVGEQYRVVQGKRITLPNLGDSEILFGSAEKPESLEGPHVDGGVWMDEAGYMSRFAYEVALRRSGFHADRGAQVLITTIPYLPAWLKNEVYSPYTKGDPTIEWIQCKTADNPLYSPAEIARARRTMRADKFATMYLGEFQKPYGIVYPEPDDEELLFDFDIEFPDGIPEAWPCYAGHDFGFNAPTTGVWGRLDDENDILYLIAEYERGGKTLDGHLREWTRLGLDGVDLAFGDPSNPMEWQRAWEMGYPAIAAKNDIIWGIDAVFERFSSFVYDRNGNPSPKLRIARGLNNLIDYKARYVWDSDPKDDTVLLDKPKKPQPAEHLMDGLRYLVGGLITEGITQAPPSLMVGQRGFGGLHADE